MGITLEYLLKVKPINTVMIVDMTYLTTKIRFFFCTNNLRIALKKLNQVHKVHHCFYEMSGNSQLDMMMMKTKLLPIFFYPPRSCL